MRSTERKAEEAMTVRKTKFPDLDADAEATMHYVSVESLPVSPVCFYNRAAFTLLKYQM